MERRRYDNSGVFGAGQESAPGSLVAPGASWELERPARAAEVSSDVTVPLMQAAISGGLLAGVVTFGLWLLNGELAFLALLKLFGMLALLGSGAAWLVLLGQHRRLLWVVERALGSDVDRDGTVGKPEERVVLVNPDRLSSDADQEARVRMGRERRSRFVQFVLDLETVGTAQRTWVDERGMQLQEYKGFRDVLLRLGVARWKSYGRDGAPHERLGWALTVPAMWVVSRIDD